MHDDEETLAAVASDLDADTPADVRAAIAAIVADPKPARIRSHARAAAAASRLSPTSRAL